MDEGKENPEVAPATTPAATIQAPRFRVKRRTRLRKPFWVPVFLVINCIVFAMWTFSLFGVGEKFMINNFLISPLHLALERWWTPITSAFSHNNIFHFMINMIVLLNFGPIIEAILGRKSFFRFYLIAAVAGSLGHCLGSYYIMGNPAQMALGASGALSGVILLFSLSFPKEKLYILGLIPIPAFFGALVFVGIDIWGLVAQAKGGGLPIGHGAHLGGALAGAIYFMIARSFRRRQQPQL